MDSTTPDSVDGAELTHARDVMTTSIISVGPDVPVREIATLLLDKRISAVPVVNNDGVPIGIVSEGDLVGRGERERLTRRDLVAGSHRRETGAGR
jgi:CBS domain-containing protein